jgi:hypothetical protein
MLLPLFVTNNFNDVEESLLKGVIRIVECALYDNLVVARENFILFEYHRAGPRAVINRKVNDPLMSGSRRDVAKQALKVRLVLEPVTVEYGHLGDRDYLAALLQKSTDANVAGEGK